MFKFPCKSIQSFYMIVLVLAILASGCTAGLGQPAPVAAPPPIVAGEMVALYERTTAYLIDLGMKDAFGVIKYLKEDTGDLVIARTAWKGITEFVSINLKTLRINSGVTGNLINTSDWNGIEALLKDLGFKVVTAAEVAASYTGKIWSTVKAIGGTTTILVVPVGIIEDPFWWQNYTDDSAKQ